jgi:NifU-like protein involved in Fe-S cluster formation
MSRDPRYSTEVQRRMRELPCAGHLDGDDRCVRGQAGDPEQGASVSLELRVLGKQVSEARFQAFGCPHLIAAASWLCERLNGAERTDLCSWDWQEVADALDIPPAKYGRLLVLQDALRDAAGNWSAAPVSTV